MNTKGKVMKKFHALFATLFAATSVFAADILEIRPCDEFGNSTTWPTTTINDPIGSGENLYFNIRLVSRENNKSTESEDVRSKYQLDYFGVAEKMDAVVNPLKIGIVVSGKTKWASLVKCQRTPSATAGIDTLNLTDLIFEYHTEPGDFSLPIKLAADANGTPVGEDDSGASYIFRNNNLWGVRYYNKDRSVVDDAQFLFTSSTAGIDLSDYPDVNALRSNYSLKDCGFHVQTVNFEQPWETENEWRAVQQGVTVKGRLDVVAAVTNAVTLYVWSQDETVAVPVGSNVSKVSMNVPDATGKPVAKDVMVAAVKIQGGQSYGEFNFKGITKGKTANFVLSGFNHYNWNGTGTGAMITDFVTVPVTCTEPPPPYVEFALDGKETTVEVPVNQKKSVAQFDLTLSAVWEGGDGKVKVTVAPVATDSTKVPDIYQYVHISDTLNETTAWNHDGTVSLTFDTQATVPVMTQPVYVYALGGCKDTSDEDSPVKFKVVKIEPAAAAVFYGTIKDSDFLYVKPVAADVIEPAADETISVVGERPRELLFKVDDNYFNRNDRKTGYQIYWCQDYTGKPSETTLLGGRWAIADGVLCKLNDDGTVDEATLPSITYNVAGEYTAAYRLVGPNGVATPGPTVRDWQTLKIKVSDAATATATPYTMEGDVMKSCDEGDDADISISLSSAYDRDLWAYLKPTTNPTLVSGDCIVGSEFSQGIYIMGGRTSSEDDFGTITFKDGASSGTAMSFEVVLCTTDYYDPETVVTGFKSTKFTVKVLNVVPTLLYAYMDNVSLTRNLSATITVPKMFRFRVDEPSDVDLEATGGNAFQLRWTVEEDIDSAVSSLQSDTLYGNPNTNVLEYAFSKPGRAKVSFELKDKDMKTFGTPKEFYVNVTDQPLIYVDSELGRRFAETAVGTKNGKLTLHLTENPATIPLDVEITVKPGGASANPGKLILGGCTPAAGRPGVYTLTLNKGQTAYNFYIDEADGTVDSLNKGFYITAKVTTATEYKDAKMPWSEYFVPQGGDPFEIENVPPTIYTSLVAIDTLQGLCGPQNGTTNAITAGIGDYYPPITWSVADVLADMGKPNTSTNIQVVWTCEGVQTVTNVTDESEYVYTPSFTSAGIKQVTVVVTDKDVKSEGTTRASWYFDVTASKQLTTMAHGPRGTSGTQDSNRYANGAKGLGEGRTWTDQTFSKAEDWSIIWNCGLNKSATCYAWGYKVGDVDDGSLGGKNRDIKLNESGDNPSSKSTFTNYYKYMDEEGRDSFFYRWLPVQVTDDSKENSEFTSLSPEKTETGAGSLSLLLPSEEDKEGDYTPIKVEAIFSKELLPSDNMGDINQDGIPDAYLGFYYNLGVVNSAGALSENVSDLDDLKAKNDDKDYFPANFTAGAASFIPGSSNTWVVAGREFQAAYEIRGFYGADEKPSAFNNATVLAKVPGVKPDIHYANPDEDTSSTLSKVEWDAYVLAGQPGEDQWSPERPTDPTKTDTDEDGLPDGYEYYIWYKATVGWMDDDGNHKFLTGRRYNPRNPFEPIEITPEQLAAKFDPIIDGSVNWDKTDTDNDGIVDSVEFVLGTNPYDYDTDGDGLPDGYEVYFTETDPLKYATDNVHCDATLNEYGPNAAQGDAMAEYETVMETVGVVANDGSVEYFGCDLTTNFFTTVTEAGTATLFRMVSTNDENKVSTNLYITTKDVVVEGGVLIGDYPKTSTWKARYDDAKHLLRGAPVKLARGTKVSEVSEGETYYEEELVYPDVYYVLWVYGKPDAEDPVLARGKMTDAAPTLKTVCAEIKERTVKVQHYYVRMTRDFDPRTGWKDNGGQVDTRSFTHLDEFLLMTFFYRAGGLTEADITPTDNRTMVQIWTDCSTSPKSCDTDGDNMPDGWELYLMGGTADGIGNGPGPQAIYSPLYPFMKVTGQDRDNDVDLLEWPEEYSGTASSAYYSNMGCDSIKQLNTKWRNKSMPTDPWDSDTDGDGVLDGYEGGKETTPPYYGNIVREFFMYNDSGSAGGGLNPLSWDTDGDGLPDPWEIEYHGTYTHGSTTTTTTTSVDANGQSNTVETTTVVGCTWNMDGMNGTVADARLDYDNDGLANWQEYMVGAMRCWRYDDPDSGWGMFHSSKEELAAILKQQGTAEWNRYWYERLLDTRNVSGNYNPHFANGFFDGGTPYFSCCKKAFDPVKGNYYMLKDGIYHDQAESMWWGEMAMLAGMPYVQTFPQKYISCDPREPDTDLDGLDDYYELFHGLNPLLGEPAVGHSPSDTRPYDVIYDAYQRTFLGGVAESSASISALNNWWRNTVTPHETVKGSGIKHEELDGYDFIAHPWLNGIAGADPDGDNISNQEEGIMPKVQATTTYHHTDPTPLWMTDTTYTNSLTRRYYRFDSPQGDVDLSNWSAVLATDPTFEWGGVVYYLKDFPSFKWDPVAKMLSFSYSLNLWGVYNGWEFSFEENEGYDSDHDFLSDFEESQGKTKNASDPQGHDDPYRRQAMYFGGEKNKSFLQTPVANYEWEPDTPDASSEARQNFLYFTVECWAKPDADTLKKSGLQTLVERAIWADNAGPADEKLLRKNFLIGLHDGNWYASFDSTGTDAKQTVEIADGPLATTNWTHIAATFDGKALKLYVNGVCNNVHATSVQPEHGVNALAISKSGEMNPAGGTITTEKVHEDAAFISILVGASAATKMGIVYDSAWRLRDGSYNAADNPEGLPTVAGKRIETTFADYANFYKGYIDEVRIWDGARTAADIQRDYANRTRYTTELAAENRLSVYALWKQGALRSPASALQLPPQLMYHWAFDHIAGAVLPEDLIKVPAGFNTAKTVTDAKARWVRPADHVERNWNSSAVRSTVYTDNAWVPWINNTVSHLARFDLTTLDSIYWSEDYAGAFRASSYNTNYTSFTFPRTHEVYSRWVQQKYGSAIFYDMHLDPDFAIWNSPDQSPAWSQGYTQRSRWDVVSGYGSTATDTKEAESNNTEIAMAFRFAIRERNLEGDDILPMGGAYPRRISLAEGGMWDNKQGTPASASDAWAQTGKDSDNNGLPDWWEEYARANYCPGMSPKEKLTWDTEVTYRDGRKMTALAAYLRDLAEGLVKIGDYVGYMEDENGNFVYADTRDNDKDGLPDWWEELYGLDTSVDNADDDPDNDGLSNYQEYMLGEYYLKKFGGSGGAFEKAGVTDLTKVRLSPILPSSTPGQRITDYFLRYSTNPGEVKTGDKSHFYANEYFGEIATDHDFMEDWWERLYGVDYTSTSKYDPSEDKDGDGWSTWAECRASLWGGFFSAHLIDQWTGKDSDELVACYPKPVIGVRATYFGDQDISGKPLVVRTTSGQRQRVDATFIVPAAADGEERYIGSFEAGPEAALHGHLSPGMIKGTTVLFSYALLNEDMTYYWNWDWYTARNIDHPNVKNGTFADYLYYVNLYPNIQYEGAEPNWKPFTIPQMSTDGNIAVILDATGSVTLGTLDCVTGEYTLQINKSPLLSDEIINSGIAFKVAYSSRLGDAWPQTVYLSDTKDLRKGDADLVRGDGYVREGKNTIEAFIDLDDDGKYTIGEPIGVVQNVDVGWHKTPVVVIELKDTVQSVPRYDVQKGADDRAAILGWKYGTGDSGAGDGEDTGTSASGVSKTIAIRRVAINGIVTNVTSTGMLVPVPKRTLASKTLVLDSRSYITEADVLSDTKFDLDYKWLVRDAQKMGMARSEVMNATYEMTEVVTLANGVTSNIVLNTFINTFNAQRARPVIVSPREVEPVYSCSPTFAFTSDDETMTAYRLQVRQASGEKALVYDSGIALLPGRVPNTAGTAVYEVTPPIYAGAHVWSGITTNHLLFADSANYEWRVALFNAKYCEIEGGETGAWSAEDGGQWTTFQMDVQNQHRYPDMATGYGCLTMAVRYFGPTNLAAAAEQDRAKIYVEVFEGADFCGQPLARAEATIDETLSSDEDLITTNVIVRGIAPGVRYARAFIDFNGNGKRDEWESWGYVNEVGNGVKSIYNPIAIDVTAAAGDWKPIAAAQYTLFVEDCDSNQNEIPDCIETLFYSGEGNTATARDSDGDGIADIDEESYSTNKALWDSDSDGMPDGWEAMFANTDPTLNDAEEVIDGDVMAFAKVSVRTVTVGGTNYVLVSGAKVPNVGDAPNGLAVYTTYKYPVWENGVIVEYKGIGKRLTLTTADRITDVAEDATAVLVHAQVYENFGFDSTTATTTEGAKNTKAFTALDKYLVVRYLDALGMIPYDASKYESGEDYVNRNGAAGTWSKYTLRPYVIDGDDEQNGVTIGDGIADGWELYVMFGPDGSTSVKTLSEAKISPWNYNDARDFSPDGKNADGTKREDVGLRLIDEYDGGNSPTDPWNLDTNGDNVIDKFAFQYHLKGGDSGKDFDGDGLSNYAEYLISEVFKFAKLDPDDPKTDGSCVDYFRKAGDLYFGEMFTDHDQVNDVWEQKYADKVGTSSDLFANRDIYDPGVDYDNDGWSNWAEAQAGTNPEVEASPGIDGNLQREYPVPAIAARVVFSGFHGKNALTGPLVFQAWSEKTDPDMAGAPDATWTVATDEGSTNVTRYIGVNPGTVRSYYLGTGSVAPGSVRIDFRDMAYEKAVLVNGAEVKTYPGETGSAQWYYFVQDYNGVLYTTATNSAPVQVGTIDYSSGLMTVDFGNERLQGISYGIRINGDTSTAYESNADGEYSNYDKLNLSRSYVKLNWTPVKVMTTGNATYYLSDTGYASSFVREGRNKFVVFADCVTENGKWDPGEPFGFVHGVDVGWQGGAFTVELTETSPVFARVDLTSTSGVATDREYWQAGQSTVKDISDDKYKDLKESLGAVVAGSDDAEEMGQDTEATLRKTRVRVVRVMVDGKTVMGKDADGNDVDVQKAVVMDKYINLEARNYLHEGDFIDDGSYDVGWGDTLENVYGMDVRGDTDATTPKFIDATNITYMIVFGEGMVGVGSSNTVFRCLVDRVYDSVAARYGATSMTIRPVIDNTQPQDYVYGARPTFRWIMRDGKGNVYNSYTAFQLQIMDASGSVVYNSGYRALPARDAEGWYNWALEDPIGTIVHTSGNYSWRVALFNAKFRDDTFWGNSAATWSASGKFVVDINQQQPMNDHGYSSIAAAVKYAGPSNVVAGANNDKTKVGKVILQAFATADFAGAPLAQSYVTSAESIRDTAHNEANAYVYGLPQSGTYYLRAFVDSNGNGKKDDFESWGAAREAVTISELTETRPTVGIYIEDADTDGDWIPDAYEYMNRPAGVTDWATVQKYMSGQIAGGDQIAFSAEIDRAGISTGLTGASLTAFQNLSFIMATLGVSDTASIAAIRRAVEVNVDPNTVKVTALTLSPDGKRVSLSLSAETTDSVAGAILGKVYDLSSAWTSAAVTVKVYAKENLATVEWTEVGTYTTTFARGANYVDVAVDGIDMTSGFYRVEVQKIEKK